MDYQRKKILMKGNIDFPAYFEEDDDIIWNNEKSVIDLKEYFKLKESLSDKSSPTKIRYVRLCLHAKNHLLHEFYVIICQYILRLKNENVIQMTNCEVGNFIHDAGILNKGHRIALFTAISPLSSATLKELLQVGFKEFGFNFPNEEYIRFLAIPGLAMPYSYTDETKNEIHKGEHSLCFNKCLKSFMDNPLMLKQLLRACFMHLDEIERDVANEVEFKSSMLRDISYRAEGNTLRNGSHLNNFIMGSIAFFIRSNFKDMKKTIDYLSVGFSMELSRKIMFEPVETITQNINANDFVNHEIPYKNIHNVADEELYPLFDTKTLVLRMKNSRVNSFFGKQYPKTLEEKPHSSNVNEATSYYHLRRRSCEEASIRNRSFIGYEQYVYESSMEDDTSYTSFQSDTASQCESSESDQEGPNDLAEKCIEAIEELFKGDTSDEEQHVKSLNNKCLTASTNNENKEGNDTSKAYDDVNRKKDNQENSKCEKDDTSNIHNLKSLNCNSCTRQMNANKCVTVSTNTEDKENDTSCGKYVTVEKAGNIDDANLKKDDQVKSKCEKGPVKCSHAHPPEGIRKSKKVKKIKTMKKKKDKNFKRKMKFQKCMHDADDSRKRNSISTTQFEVSEAEKMKPIESLNV